jgi:TrkA domain protein
VVYVEEKLCWGFSGFVGRGGRVTTAVGVGRHDGAPSRLHPPPRSLFVPVQRRADVTVYESDLPGVGKKFEVELNDDSRLVVVIHNTGRREVYLRPDDDSDSEKLFEMSDRLARQVGTILEGAYFQPIRTDTIDTVLGDDTLLEWVKLSTDSPVVGKTLAESNVRANTGATVVAIQREGDTISSPDANTDLEADDILIVVGSRDDCRAFQSFVDADTSSVAEDIDDADNDLRSDGGDVRDADSDRQRGGGAD